MSREAFRLTAERGLLLVSAAFVFVNMLALSLARGRFDIIDWLHYAVWCVCAAGGHLLLDRRLPIRDPLLFPLAMFLSGWGLVLIDRLAPFFADRQTVWLLVSTSALLGTALVPDVLRILRSFRYTLLVVGIALLVATIFLGK